MSRHPGGSARALESYLRDHQLPEAIFCFTDSLAIGALSVLHLAGHRVPEDVLVAGFDDIDHGKFAVPALTTISFDKRALAEEVMRLLRGRMVDRKREPVQLTLPYQLVKRASSAAN
ncbi:substrate-binding domain-containing protein [Arthrobacter psychrolactophilus]